MRTLLVSVYTAFGICVIQQKKRKKVELVKLCKDNERGKNLALKAGFGSLGKVLQTCNGRMDGIYHQTATRVETLHIKAHKGNTFGRRTVHTEPSY